MTEMLILGPGEKKNVIRLDRIEILSRIHNPPEQGTWLLSIDPEDYQAKIVLRNADGYVPDIQGHEDLFPLSMTIERDDGLLLGGDWVVARTPDQRQHDGLYRSYWIIWDPPAKVISIELVRQLRIFLCHAAEDKPAVKKVYNRLVLEGFQPWLDEENLLPGQDWRYEIDKAVRSSHLVIAFLSQRSISKTGYVHAEIKLSLDIVDEHPEGSTFIIPILLEPCELPSRLSRWQYVKYYEQDGHRMLKRALLAKVEETFK